MTKNKYKLGIWMKILSEKTYPVQHNTEKLSAC